MNKEEKYYNFHDILVLKVTTENGHFKKLFDNINKEYKFFACDPEETPDLVINLVKEGIKPSTAGNYYLVDGDIIRQGYLYCRDSYKQAKWEVEIKGLENEKTTTANICSNFWGSMFATSYIVNRLIIFKASEKGYSFIHAGCVSKDNRAYLFPARSAAGKTTTCLRFVEKGFSYLGDDFVILSKGNVLCFPTPLNIFRYNATPLVNRNIGSKTRLALLFTHLVYKASLGYAKIFAHMDVENIVPKDTIVNKSQLSGVFLLIPKSGDSEVCTSVISKNELITQLVSNEKIESFPFFKYMVEYSYVFPNGGAIANYWRNFEATLRDNLTGDIPTYRIEMPQRYDSKVFEELFMVVQQNSRA